MQVHKANAHWLNYLMSKKRVSDPELQQQLQLGKSASKVQPYTKRRTFDEDLTLFRANQSNS